MAVILPDSPLTVKQQKPTERLIDKAHLVG
jgi:hypothetical protein